MLLTIDGRPIESPELFESFVERADVNRDFKLKVLRQNSPEPLELSIRFEIRPDGYVGVPMTENLVQKGSHKMDKEWGVMVIPSTPDSAARIGAGSLEGIVVLNATPGGLAYRAGIRNGSLILKMNGREVRTIDEYEQAKSESGEIELEFWQKSEIKTVRLATKGKQN